jgi:hypothetical protein
MRFLHQKTKIDMKQLFTFLLIVLLSLPALASKDGGWEKLFNGKDLTGWKQLNGKAKYEVVKGEIVGTTVFGTPNSFLVTEKNYADFILELDLLVADDMNSGIQIRSESKPDYNNGRVHGYQVEVDPSTRAWSGGIYDEARRGWLYTNELNPAAKAAFKNGQWNHYRVECIGNSIRTWLNEVPVAWVIDDMTPAGFIALQVHQINSKEKEGEQIRWKNIRIKTKDIKPSPFNDIYVVNLIPNTLSEPEKQQGFHLLFDGKTTNGWESAKGGPIPGKDWVVKDGNLTVLSKEEEPNRAGDIVTKEKFRAFELKFDFNLSPGANSGVKYCSGNNGPSIGLEYQVLDDSLHADAKAGIGGNRTLASLYDLIAAKKESRFINQPGGWNLGAVVLYPNNHVEHWLNGRKVVEYERGSDFYWAQVARSKFAGFKDFGMAKEAPVLLQDHGDKVMFRSIKIRELK